MKSSAILDDVVAAISGDRATSGLMADDEEERKRLVTIELQVNHEQDATNSKFVQKAYVNVPSCTVDSIEKTNEPVAIEVWNHGYGKCVTVWS